MLRNKTIYRTFQYNFNNKIQFKSIQTLGGTNANAVLLSIAPITPPLEISSDLSDSQVIEVKSEKDSDEISPKKRKIDNESEAISESKDEIKTVDVNVWLMKQVIKYYVLYD